MTINKSISIIVLACAAAGFSPVAHADEPHDSNTLHKIGSSIQYVVRKSGENLSKTVHKGTNHKAVSKMGSAIEYPIRKDAQNISVDTHNVEGKKSTLHQNDGTDKVIPPLPHNKRKHLFQ